MPSQDVLLWHKVYFELKVIEKKQMREKFSTFSLCKSWMQISKGVPLPFSTQKDKLVTGDNFRTYQPKRRNQRKIHNKACSLVFIPLVSLHIFTFPQFATLGSLQLLSFLMSFLQEHIFQQNVFCWRCYTNQNSKPSLWVTHFPLGVSPLCMRYMN